MTRQRARAYARVTMTLQELGAAKLLPAEQSRIRLAADTLLFCADISHSRSGRAAFADVSALCEHLVSSGRWASESAGRLVDDLWACGPGFDAALPVAA
jgi:hypothetical protein